MVPPGTVSYLLVPFVACWFGLLSLSTAVNDIHIGKEEVAKTRNQCDCLTKVEFSALPKALSFVAGCAVPCAQVYLKVIIKCEKELACVSEMCSVVNFPFSNLRLLEKYFGEAVGLRHCAYSKPV